MLGRKLARELLRQKGQTIAVTVVIALGVMLFLASAAAYVDLRDSYAASREQLGLADLHVDVAALTPADVATIARQPGVALADGRRIGVAAARVGRALVQLRVLSLPDERDPLLDRVLVVSGTLPLRDDEILLEKHLAQHHRLAPGDTVAIQTEGGPRTLRVTGIALSAEYLWVARDAQDFMPSPDSFGVGWMRARAMHGIPTEAEQLLVDVDPAADPVDVASSLRTNLGSDRVARIVPANELVGVRLLQLDVDGYQGMAAFFPIFFLGVGAFIVASVLARLVDAQRPLIGTLMALGVGRERILLHYLAYGVVLGALGSLVGVAAGSALAPLMTDAYAKELGIPFVAAHAHGDLVAWGVLIGVGVCALAAVVPAVRASREAPAAAMRPPRPSAGPLARLARRLPLPLPMRLAARHVLGSPLRSLATALGVAGAIVVVVSTGGLLDSMRATFRSLFHDARREDLRVELAAPTESAAILAKIDAIDGVDAAQGILALPVLLEARGGRAEALVQGLGGNDDLVRSVDADGALVPPTPGGIVITRSLASSLGVRRGDRVDVTFPTTGRRASFEVTGMADAVLGPVASMRLGDLATSSGLDGQVTSIAIDVDPARADVVREKVAALPGATRVEDTAAIRAQVNELMSLGWVLLGFMLLFGAILAGAILFNTATLGVLERRRDLATLRALGRTMRELGLALTIEHALLGCVGVLIGLPLAFAVTRQLAEAFSSDLLHLPFVVSPATSVVAVVGVLLLLLVAQIPALRSVARMSLADSVRTREG